jgi:hypothetical protein
MIAVCPRMYDVGVGVQVRRRHPPAHASKLAIGEPGLGRRVEQPVALRRRDRAEENREFTATGSRHVFFPLAQANAVPHRLRDLAKLGEGVIGGRFYRPSYEPNRSDRDIENYAIFRTLRARAFFPFR